MDIIKYEAISRVVNDDTKEVVGFMMQPLKHGAKLVYMPIDVICFGLSNKTFEICNVKLSSNHKPRGTNGFLLSKLPIVVQRNLELTYIQLLEVLKYIISQFCGKDIDKKNIQYDNTNNIGMLSFKIYLENYESIEKNIAEKELKNSLIFYLKHLPKDMLDFCDDIKGVLNENGIATISVMKNLV